MLAGHGAARAKATAVLVRFAERLNVPVATTFHGKGDFPDDHPSALGAVGFMRQDYSNCGFAGADVLICVGTRSGVRPGQDLPVRRQAHRASAPLPRRGGRPLPRHRRNRG
ncbi:hypothetical protein [Streptomyces sp. CA-106131]|uniref:hypothetical protein n=1 Tax=Streptomyces sp. CA-106131 TaxID=3240045 RepID=UPI003D9267DE